MPEQKRDDKLTAWVLALRAKQQEEKKEHARKRRKQLAQQRKQAASHPEMDMLNQWMHGFLKKSRRS